MILTPSTTVYTGTTLGSDGLPEMHLVEDQVTPLWTRCGLNATYLRAGAYHEERLAAQGCRECFTGVQLG